MHTYQAKFGILIRKCLNSTEFNFFSLLKNSKYTVDLNIEM